MPFAIKFISQTDSNKPIVRYYSQTIETLTNKGIDQLILVTDGSDPVEVDISKTLIEAEFKLGKIMNKIPAQLLKLKVVEFPEDDPND